MEWMALILSFFGIMLNAKKHIWCWTAWILGDVAWVIYFGTRDIAPTILNLMFVGANLYGWWCWLPRKSTSISPDYCI